ncbi:MAG TPA: carboxymuconolactone decarboxylase family protein [Pseudonocardiaceae bacterium]
MARIEAVPAKDAGVFGRLVYRLVRRRFGDVMEPVAVARHHRGVFRASVVHEGMVERSLRVLPAGLRALVVYRVATVLGCSWCVDFGDMKMRLDGLDTGRLGELDEYATSAAFDGTERAALAYADGMSASPPHVTDEQVAELERLLGRAGLVELTYLVALENARARFNDALGIRDQGFAANCAVSPVSPASPVSRRSPASPAGG